VHVQHQDDRRRIGKLEGEFAAQSNAHLWPFRRQV